MASISVYVVYSRPGLFIDFVRTMYQLGLTDTGEYVIIGVRNEEPFQDYMSTELMFDGTLDTPKMNAKSLKQIVIDLAMRNFVHNKIDMGI